MDYRSINRFVCFVTFSFTCFTQLVFADYLNNKESTQNARRLLQKAISVFEIEIILSFFLWNTCWASARFVDQIKAIEIWNVLKWTCFLMIERKIRRLGFATNRWCLLGCLCVTRLLVRSGNWLFLESNLNDRLTQPTIHLNALVFEARASFSL